DSRETFTVQIERQHIICHKLDAGVQLSRLVNHLRGEIQSAHVHPGVMQITRDMAGATSHVAHFALLSDVLGEAIEPFAIERLVEKFVGDAPGIFLGQAVITVADCTGEGVIHKARLENYSRTLSSSFFFPQSAAACTKASTRGCGLPGFDESWG